MAWLIRAFFIAVSGVAMAPSLAILIGVVHTIYAVYTTRGDHTKIQTYDELWYRYERIRHQVVDHLKDPAITDASRKHMLGKLDAIVKIQNTTNQWEGILTLLIRKIFSAAHIAKQDTELQQLVELLAHNDLYVESARLKIAKVDIDKEEIEDED